MGSLIVAGRPLSRVSDFTPSRREKQPFEPGNTAAIGNRGPRRHGVWSADVSERAVELVDVLFDPQAVERHPLVALLAAQTWVQLQRAETDIATRGDVIDGKENPLVGRLNGWRR